MARVLRVGPWGASYLGRRFVCSVGRSGIGVKKGEGDGVSPLGSFRIARVHYRADRMKRLPGATEIRIDDVWSDDPGDPDYNARARGLDYPFGHERMWRADRLYDLVAVLDFNLSDPVAGAGSAIFMHCWRRPRYPTEGCIAFAYADLRWILESWRMDDRVFIGV